MINPEDVEIENDIESSRFELPINGHIAFIDYKTNKAEKIFLTQVEIPQELENQGIEDVLVRKVLDYIKNKGKKLVPLSPDIVRFVQENEEYKIILASGLKV